MKKTSLRIFAALFLWGAVFLTGYLNFFQLDTVISVKRVLAAVLIATVFVTLVIIIARHLNFTAAQRQRILIWASCLTIIMLFVLPFPNNYLFAPHVDFELTYDAERSNAAAVELTWLNNGLTDIRFADIGLNEASSHSETGVQILPDSTSNSAVIHWQGRGWRYVSFTMSYPQSGEVSILVNGKNYTYSAGQGDKDAVSLNIPVGAGIFYVLLFLSVLLSLWGTAACVLALFYAGCLWVQPKFAQWGSKRSLPNISPRVVLVVLAFTNGLMIAFLALIGFFNRYYADDYCYIYRYDSEGFFNAIINAYQNMNGRYMSHLFNFSFAAFKTWMPKIGVITALILLGGSLLYFFYQLYAEMTQAKRRKYALFSALLVFSFVYLLAPALYETLYWTLSTLILIGGLAFLNLSAGLFIKRFLFSQQRVNLVWVLIFAVLGVMSAGFNEASAMLAICISGLALFVFILRSFTKAGNKLWLVSGSYFLGAVLGLLMVITAPGTSQRVSDMGVDVKFNLLSSLERFFEQSHHIFELIFLDEPYGLFLLVLLFILAFWLGANSNQPIFKAVNNFSFVERLILIAAPFLGYLVTFFPSSFVSSYFPERTMFIPLFSLILGYFILFFYYGSQVESIPKLMRILVLVLTVVFGVWMMMRFVPVYQQMRNFAVEWDAREAAIQNAIESGAGEFELSPYQYSFGTDLSNQGSDWLDICLDDYYGIDIWAEIIPLQE